MVFLRVALARLAVLFVAGWVPQASAAQQVLWITGGWEGTIRSDPYQSCLEFYAEFLDPAAPYSANLNGYKDVRLARNSATSFYCGATLNWGAGLIIPRYDVYSTYIYNQPCDNSTGLIFNDPETGICRSRAVSSKAKGVPDTQVCTFTGNPVNFSNGNKYQREVDYKSARTSGLLFERFYNSTDGLWRHSFSTHLRLGGSFIYVVLATGREVQFEVSSAGFLPVRGVFGSLVKSGPDYVYTDESNVIYRFNEKMELVEQTHLSGEHYTLTHDGFEIAIADSVGRKYYLNEDALRQPLDFSDGLVSIVYSYSGNLLISVSTSINSTTHERKYTYVEADGVDRLSTIVDERGVQLAKWEYDSAGRAVSSEHASGVEKISIKYFDDSGVVDVTNELGRVVKYNFVEINEVKKIASVQGEPTPNCPASNSLYSYNSQGLLESSVDAKGYITIYVYNDRGLETSRTEASGTPQARTTTTEWDPSRFLRTKVVEPTRTTVYTYDDQGRETARQVTPR